MTEVQFAKQFLTTLDSKNTKYQPDHVFDPKTFQTRTPYTLPKLPHPPYPLPPKPSTIPSTTAAPGSLPLTSTSTSESTINLTLKSTRNPTFTLNLLSLPVSTQVLALKPHIQSLLPSTASEKIKILYNKKPIPPTKPSINDVLDSTSPSSTPQDVEFTVMILGGAPDPSPSTQTIDLKEQTSTTTEAEAEGGGGGVGVSQSKGQEDTDMNETTATTTHPESDPVQPGEISGEAVLATTEFWDDLQGFLEQRLKDTDEAKRVRELFEATLKQ